MWKVVPIRIDGSQVCKRLLPESATMLSVAFVDNALMVYVQVLEEDTTLQETIFCTVSSETLLPDVPVIYIGSAHTPQEYGMVTTTWHVFQRMF